jgi:hypothetical protein
MKCYYHPENDAIGTCTNCGKAICQIDAVDVSDKFICKECLNKKGITEAKPVNSTPTNSLAVISLILGILGIGGCCCLAGYGGIIVGLPSLITGWIARKQIIASGQNQQGMTLAYVGMVLGSIQIIWGVLALAVWGTSAGFSIISNLINSIPH